MTQSGPLYSNPEGEQVMYDGVSPVTWRVAGYVLAVKDGKVLVVEPPTVNRWEMPGGRVEIHERVLEGAIRECWEETGYRFLPDREDPICIAEWNYLSPSTGHFHHSLMLAFLGTVEDAPDPAWRNDPTEVRRLCWIDPATLTPDGTHTLLWKALQIVDMVAST